MIFLLTQNGQILGGAEKPSAVPFERLDPQQSWEIVAGVGGPNYRSIIGPVVSFQAAPGATCYRVTAPMDGFARLIGKAGNSVEVLRDRILVSERCGDFSDHANLTRLKLWECRA